MAHNPTAAANWTRRELAKLNKLRTPLLIQEFLDNVAYRIEDEYFAPRDVLRDRRAHCFDGALFAAAALRRLGVEVFLMDLRAVNDDDHVLAVFRSGSCLGAVAKSNFSGLRFREAVYRTPRELALSYFNDYYNMRGERTLRAYSRLVPLRRFDALGWMFERSHLYRIADALDDAPHFRLITGRRALSSVDKLLFRAGTICTDRRGTYSASG